MKIAIIINTSWNIYNFRKGLVQHFLGRGDQVLAVAPRDEYSQKLQDWGCEYHHLQMEGSGMNPLRDLSLLIKLIILLRRLRPDVILSYTIKPNIYSSIAGGLLGIPCICNVSGLGTVFLWKGWVRKMASFLYTVAFRFNRWIFFQNEDDQKQFLHLIRVRREKTSLLPGSGINLSAFPFHPYTKQEQVVFLMISRLIVEKGIREYAEAIKILRKQGVMARFQVIGMLDESHQRSITRAELEEWQRQGIVEYFEPVEDIRPLIAAAEVVVLPSYREGTPRTLLEAGAMGKALIATDVPGCRHVVRDGYNGFLCRPKDSEDLARKMRLYLSLTPREKTLISQQSRLWIEEKFDEKRVIELYARKIGELLRMKE